MPLVVDVLEVNDWMRDYERIAVPVRTSDGPITLRFDSGAAQSMISRLQAGLSAVKPGK